MNDMKSSESLIDNTNAFGKRAKSLFDNFKESIQKIQAENGIGKTMFKESEYRKMDSLFQKHNISNEFVNDKEQRMYHDYNQFYQTSPDTYEDIYDENADKNYNPSSDEDTHKFNHPLIRNKFKNTTFTTDEDLHSNFSGYLSSEYNLYERKLIKSKTVSFNEKLSTCISEKSRSNGSIKIHNLLRRKAGKSILRRPSTFFVERLGNEMVTDPLPFDLQNKASFFDNMLDRNQMLKKAKSAFEPLNFSLF